MNECNNHAAEIVLGVPKETPNTISDFRSRCLPSNRCRVQLKALGKHKFGSKLRVFVLPSLYSPEIRPLRVPLAEEIDGAEEGGLPGAGMRQEAVRAVDGLADGRGMEEAVRLAVGHADDQWTADGTEVAVRRAVRKGGRPSGWPPPSGVRSGWRTAIQEKQPSIRVSS